MPTSTWDRLPAARRDAVAAAAEAEFAANGFSGGSMNTIAAEAGVAKGSLFQYFDDKADLCRYISEVCSVRVRDQMTSRVAELRFDGGFAESLRDVTLAWIDYFGEHPVDLALTEANVLEPDPAMRRAVREASTRHYTEVLRPLLEAARDAGLLAPDSDLDALLALLLLVLPHLAIAPYSPGLDPILGLDGEDPEATRAGVERLIRAFVVQHEASAGA